MFHELSLDKTTVVEKGEAKTQRTSNKTKNLTTLAKSASSKISKYTRTDNKISVRTGDKTRRLAFI